MKTLNMNDDHWNSRAWVNQAVRDAAEQLRQRLVENIALVRAADPDGHLAEISAVLAQKRGCRR